MSPRAKAVLVVIAGLAVVNGVLRGIDSVSGGEPGGPTSSAYATGPSGLGAYAELLGRAGHPVERVGGRASGRSLPTDGTVVVLDPDFVSATDREALANFVDGGGRLIAGGSGSGWLRHFTGTTAARVSAEDIAGPLAPTRETEGVSRVATSGIGWERTGRALPVLGGRDGTLLAVAGGGRALLLADAAALQNRLLAHEDNAALGVALAGPPSRPVLFLEGYHGFGRASGIAAIPHAWIAALALLGAAALVFMLARGRRLGPPEAAERELPPPRREYVDSLGATLARTRQPAEALQPLVTHVRTEVARRAGLPLSAAPDELVAAGIRLGLAPDDARAVLAPLPGTVDVLAAGRVLAAVEGRTM